MPPPIQPPRRRGAGPVVLPLAALCAAVLLLGDAGPAWAAKSSAKVTMIEWNHPWSIWKIAGCVFTIWLCWEACYHFVFKWQIDGHGAPWPRDAYAWSMATFVALGFVMFVVWFALFSDTLRQTNWNLIPPGPLVKLNAHLLWIGLLLGSLVGALIVYNVLKHRQAAR